MPKRFNDADVLLPPATGLKRGLAITYDTVICIAVVLVVAWIYTIIAGQLTGWEKYEKMAEAGQIEGGPGLTFTLFLVLYLFFGYFWTKMGQTLGMQVWRVRIQNLDGVSVSLSQALRRYVTAAAVVFLTLLAGYYLGAVSLLFSIPAIVTLFVPINGLSLTDRMSDSVVVEVERKKL
jgi:uncharacterized RDD family membrane protein YckC